MSVIVVSAEQISSSPLNTSTAKQMFSFAKGARFPTPRQLHCCEKFYDLPSTRVKRATTFGVGERMKALRRARSPPPGSYRLPSDFENGGRRGGTYSFGAGREVYARVYMDHKPAVDITVPGPGSYDPAPTLGRDSRKVAFRPNTSNPMHLLLPNTPGPGNYEVLPCISPTGTQFFSKFASSKAAVFHPVRSERFEKMPREIKMKPGPGQYPVYPGISQTGVYFLSKYKSSLCRSFGARLSDPSVTIGAASDAPGPGSYVIPSDFGIYRAQEKYIKEAERVALKRNVTATAQGRSRQDRSNASTRSKFSSNQHSQLRHNSSAAAISRDKQEQTRRTTNAEAGT